MLYVEIQNYFMQIEKSLFSLEDIKTSAMGLLFDMEFPISFINEESMAKIINGNNKDNAFIVENNWQLVSIIEQQITHDTVDSIVVEYPCDMVFFARYMDEEDEYSKHLMIFLLRVNYTIQTQIIIDQQFDTQALDSDYTQP